MDEGCQSIVSKSKFAQMAGVSKPAITKALAEGRAIATIDGKIDVTHPINRQYIAGAKLRPVSARGRVAQQPPITRPARDQIFVLPPPPTSPTKPRPRPQPAPNDDECDIEHAAVSKAAIDIEKIKAQVAREKLRLAEQMSVLIPRKVVEQLFGVLGGVIQDHLLPLGERVAPEALGVCGIEDVVAQQRVQAIIDTEVTRAVEAVKKAVVEAL